MHELRHLIEGKHGCLGNVSQGTREKEGKLSSCAVASSAVSHARLTVSTLPNRRDKRAARSAVPPEPQARAYCHAHGPRSDNVQHYILGARAYISERAGSSASVLAPLVSCVLCMWNGGTGGRQELHRELIVLGIPCCLQGYEWGVQGVSERQ